MPWSGTRDSVVQRLWRALLNVRLDVRTLYGPTVGHVLSWLNNPRGVIVVLDRTMIQDALNILMVSVAFRGRSLPLAWKIQKKEGSFQLRHIRAALRFVASWTPPDARIWVVDDREFQHVALQRFVRDELGWHFVQRLDQSTWVYPRGRTAFKLRHSGLQRGQFRSFGRVQVTIGYWRLGEDEPWYLLSDQTLGREAVRIYVRRFWIEEMFRHFKSQGWDIEASRIRHPAHFQRLVLMIALAYVWFVHICVALVKRGLRRWVDRCAHRTLSYFRLGWNWLDRLLAHDHPMPAWMCMPISPK